MTAAAGGVLARREPATDSPLGVEAVRRELRRLRPSPAGGRWPAERLSAQLPRVALDEALAILLEWRADPRRFEAGAVAWHARLAGHAPGLTLAEAHAALAALRDIAGPQPEEAALRLSALSRRHRLDEVTAVLDGWLAERRPREAS